MSEMLDIKCLYDKYRIQKKNVIHIGAGDGRESELYKKLSIPFVLWVEANPQTVRDLEKKLTRRNNIVIQALIHDSHSYTEFKVTNKLACSSMLELDMHKHYYPDVKVEEVLRLKTSRMEEIIEELDIVMNDYNFLNIDVQGVELSAIKSFGRHLKYINYIHTEVNIESLYRDCCMLWDLDNFLLDNEFIRLDTSMTGKGWGDALYKRISL